MGLPEDYVRGEGHHAAKMTEDQVRAARWLHHEAGVGRTTLARRYAMLAPSMGELLQGTTWKHVKPDPERDAALGRAALADFLAAAQASAKQVERLAIQTAVIKELETALYAVLRHHPKGMSASMDQLARVERNTTAPREARELAAAILKARRALLSSAERLAA